MRNDHQPDAQGLRDALKASLDHERMTEALSARTLTAMRGAEKRGSRGLLTRVAAISAAAVMLFGLGLLVGKTVLHPKPELIAPAEATPTPAPTESPDPSPTPSPTPKQTEGESLAQLLDRILIDIDWPEYPAVYTPGCKWFPLVNTPAIYNSCVIGDISFVDYMLRPLEAGFMSRYYAICDIAGQPKAYAFVPSGADSYTYALMLTDGSVPRDETEEDGYFMLLENGMADSPYFVSVGETIAFLRNDGKYSLYNLETRAALKLAYDSIESCDGMYQAVRDGRTFLLDEKGSVLYESDASGFYGEYVLDPASQLFYRTADMYFVSPESGNEYKSLQKFGEYCLLLQDANTAPGMANSFYVADSEGNKVLESEYQRISYSTSGGNYLCIAAYSEVIALGRDGTLLRFSSGAYSQMPWDWDNGEVSELYCDGSELFYEIRKDAQTLYYAMDEAGSIRPAEYYEANFYASGEDRIRYRYPDHYGLIDENGKLLLETDGYLRRLGEFVVLHERDAADTMRTDPAAVYNLDGTLLLNGIIGYIDEVLGPDGSLFVYADPDTCIQLFPDGRTVPVPNAPTVESKYFGG